MYYFYFINFILFQKNRNINLELPGIGSFLATGNIIAFDFQNSFIQTTKSVPKRSLTERKKYGEMTLT